MIVAIEQQLLERVSALLGRRDLSHVEFANWLAGAADGGPNGDGLYPLTDSTGFTRMLPCPAKQMTGGALPLQPSIEALLTATAADVGPDLQLVGLASNGDVKRFSTSLFPARTTEKVDELHSGEFAEWLLCIANGSNKERRIATRSLRQSVGNVIDPTHSPYNVVYDFQKAKPVKTVNGSNLIETGDSVFLASRDIGKLVAISNAANVGALEGYIGEVLDAKRIRIFTTPDFTTPANAQSNRSAEEMVWGTDCTAGMQAAFDAAEPVGRYGRGKVVVIGGMTLVRELRFGSINIIGLAQTGCGFAALPKANTQQPFVADKNIGIYATLKPDAYTIRNITIFAQRFTQFYSSFRNGFEIRGGDFGKFIRGAPYGVIAGLDVYEAQWNGIVTNGAFAGLFNDARAYSNAQVGMRMAFWDLNGTNWHAEGNGCCGVYSFMPGANVNTVRCSFNGVNGGSSGNVGGYLPHEYGSNWTEGGYGNTISNLRMQESWCDSLCFTGVDPLQTSGNRGSKNAFFIGTFDDTGNMVPGQGRSTSGLPGVRAMVYAKGNTCIDNTVEFVTGSGQVKPRNYATNAYWDQGDPSGNHVNIRTPGITNAVDDWYPGGVVSGSTTSTVATARGPWGTSSSSSLGARANIITVNGALAP